MSAIIRGAVDQALLELQRRSRNVIYKDDPVLWAEEILGVTLWSGQKTILRSLVTHKKTAVKSCHSIGKDMPLDTPIPTPNGWTTMGELKVGDQVFGADGKPTNVVFVSEDMHTVNYELTFSDGTTVVAGADHQWNTLDMTARSRVMSRGANVDWREYWGESKTRTTREIVDTLRTRIDQPNHLVPINAPLEYPEADLPIDPYVLGAWLGDGAKGAPYIYAAQDGTHILDKFREAGYTITKLESDPYGYRFSEDRATFRDLGVFNDKHIPAVYMRASVEQRKALLRGILDTDGFVVNTASAGIDLANERLATDVAELIRSLGVKVNIKTGKMTVSGRTVPGLRYRMAFTPTFNPFSEGGHKHDKFSRGKISRSRATGRTITAARVVPTVTSRCIQVDNADSLFLATRNLLPTHNTFVSAIAACWWVSTRPDSMVQTTAPTYQQVHGLLWEEIRKMHARAGLVGRVLDKDVWKRELYGVEVEVGVGKKPADSNIHGFHGTHRPDGVLVILDEGCHDDQTEVLTQRGWVKWPEVVESDLFLTMDPETEETSYARAERLISYDYDGDLYYYRAKGADFAVTPNHEMLYQQKRGPKYSAWRKAEMQDMTYGNRYAKKAITWPHTTDSVFTLPEHRGARKVHLERQFNLLDWAEFIGWFGSEGSISKNLRSVQISQQKPEYRDEIRQLLGRMFNHVTETPAAFIVSDSQLAQHLAQFGRTCDVKRLPNYVRAWGTDALERMIEAYTKGDGTFYPHKGRDVIYTSNEDMAGDLQEAILKMGFPSVVHHRNMAGVTARPLADGRSITSTRDGFIVTRPHRQSQVKFVRDNVEVRPYKGKVYCATIPGTHTLFTRRNGYTLWSGNCGIPQTLYTASDAITTAPMDRVLSVGNPDDPNTEFGRIFNQPTGEWHLMTVSAYDTPNFTGEDIPEYLKNSLPDPVWVESRKKEWGEDSARFKAKVLAEFPEQGSDAFFSQATIDTAYDLELPDDLDAPCILGVDVAAYGDNYSVIYSNRNGRVRQVARWSDGNAITSAEIIVRTAVELGASEVRIDASGFGSSIVDLVVDQTDGRWNVYGVKGGWASQNLATHANARAEQFDNLRAMMSRGEIDLDRDDVELSKQLLALKYKFTTKGGIQIESKKEMASRGAPSPDELDAVVYATLNTETFNDPNSIDSLNVGDRIYMHYDEAPSWWIGF